MVYTIEAKRVEDLLQADFSRPAQMEDEELSALARAVLDGLTRMVADFRAKPVAREVLDAAMAGVRADLETSREHERTLREQVESVDRIRAQMEGMRPTRRGRAKHRDFLIRVANLKSLVEKELRNSERMSAAYTATLNELEVIPPKLLTREEQEQVKWIDERLAKLRAAQEKIAENPELALEVAQELSEHVRTLPDGFKGTAVLEAQPVDPPASRQKIISDRIDEKTSLAILGASCLGAALLHFYGPAVSMVGIVLGATLGILSHPLLRKVEGQS